MQKDPATIGSICNPRAGDLGKRAGFFTLGLILLFLGGGPIGAQSPGDTLRVGIFESPPLAMKVQGEWTGISVDVWRELARKMGADYVWVERELPRIVQEVSSGELDAGIGAITVTAEREQLVNFSFPYFTTSLGIATRHEKRLPLGEFFFRFFTPSLFRLVGLLLAVLMVAGTLMWLVERRKNPAMFGSKPHQGIWDGIYWAFVTMTTVGYGDKTPKTHGGRLIALLWMFSSIVITASFTGALAAHFTLLGQDGVVKSIKDLPASKVGTVDSTFAWDFLRAKGYDPVPFPDTYAALDALKDGTLDCVVDDRVILQYLVNTRYPNLLALPDHFQKEYYSIVLPPDMAELEAWNRQMMRVITHVNFEEGVQGQYFGEY